MSSHSTILIIDDHETVRETVADMLHDLSHEVFIAENKERAITMIDERSFDLVLTDLKLPDGTGIEILAHAKQLYPAMPVVMITGHGSIENAVEATRLGAYEYLTKPVDLERVKVVVRNALHLVGLERKVVRVEAIDAIVGCSEAMEKTRQLIRQVAPLDATVLIQGESGTGKELVANAIQGLSLRRDKPFIKVNVAALSSELLESELFGHEKGAFSHALRQRKGRFELADGGTLFLDEIGEMPMESQVNFLRVLQEREFERVGGTETISVDFRLLAATNKDLKTLVREGSFREDLFFRVNVIRIEVPPLRERLDDVPLLAEQFLRKHCTRYAIEKSLAAETIEMLVGYAWPGNVRELENAIESAIVRTPKSEICPQDLPEDISGEVTLKPTGRVSAGRAIADIEKEYILQEIERLGGNKTKAAKSLGIGLKTLYRKLETYGYGQDVDNAEA